MEELPTDIAKLISDFVPDSSKRQLRLASTKWFNVINYSNFKFYFTKKNQWPEIVDRLEKYHKPISLHLKKNIMDDTEYIVSGLTRLTNLTEFHVDQASFTDFLFDPLTVLTNLRTLKGFNDVPLSVYLSFIHLKSIQDIKLKDFENPNVTDAFTKLTDLEELAVWNGTADDEKSSRSSNNDEFWLQVANSHTKLTKLCVNGKNNIRFQRLFQFHSVKKLKYRGGTPASLKHLTALERLSGNDGEWNNAVLKDFNSTNLTCLKMNGMPESLYGSPILTQLKKLKVSDHDDMEYLKSFPNLTYLYVYFLEGVDAKITSLGNIGSIKLQSLAVDSLDIIDLQPLVNLTTLESLSITTPSESCSITWSCLRNLTALSCELTYSGDDLSITLNKITQLTRLQRLRFDCLHANDVTIDISALCELENLDLNLTAVTIRGLSKLSKLTSLEIFSQNRPSLKGLEHLTNLKSLYCHFKSKRWNFLTALTNLEYLGVTLRKGSQLEYITGLSKLTSLGAYLSTEPSFEESIIITRLTALQELDWCPDISQTLLDTFKANLPHFWNMK